MDARNFVCLTSDIGKLCGILYTFMSPFLASQKSLTENTDFLGHNQATGVVLISHSIGHHGTHSMTHHLPLSLYVEK